VDKIKLYSKILKIKECKERKDKKNVVYYTNRTTPNVIMYKYNS